LFRDLLLLVPSASCSFGEVDNGYVCHRDRFGASEYVKDWP
jgi:hypothetical protein